jgi:phosphomannomutase
MTLQGLTAYLLSAFGERAKACGVVLAYDHRARPDLGITSHRFALLSAAALTSRGIKVHLFNRLAATPLVPFTVRHVGASE